uniref:Uncharacterized protein n=1 Tax=Candidatus Kentrum sp. TUN TaxID=2126343 RepID=A0A450ZMY7_9GAMM|nr:MAG: hypothetical protein BECKTUN1418F_GA0071002_10414 [Candidatus Kentron sp. TUN]VFK55107.1 MAG: hypothetical protein BECKTUN1418D_GA0071000_102719 [Candidatus Kentron sp. TUN]VFK56376.1 MAG: hypothetical protein BECKTUN1418E_GA0071001_10414 [Candidatus Kentron sp. TUN]
MKIGIIFKELTGVDIDSCTFEEAEKLILTVHGKERLSMSYQSTSFVPMRGNVFPVSEYIDIDKEIDSQFLSMEKAYKRYNYDR